MKIFTEIKNSIYNKKYYNTTVLNQSLRTSIKYLAKLSLLVAIIGVVIFAISIPFLSSTIKKSASSFVSSYPDDLVVSIKDGNASVNRTEPYMVKVPNDLINTDNSNSLKIENLVTINTTEPFTIDKFHQYSTLSLLTKKELVLMQSNKGEVKVMSLSDLGNIELTKTYVLEKEVLLNKILPWIMAILIPVLYVGMSLGIFIGTIIILFFYAAIVWFVLKIKGIKVSYKKAYQIALHASTLLIIFGAFSSFFSLLNNSFVRSLILIIIIYLNFDNFLDATKKEESKIVREIE
ncbi:MAG TPA: DUF1189 family protein [Candidatus Paceibacterota bacterium]